jgi:sigma-B regulation protein RsbU (phosphoserine phosphatase)
MTASGARILVVDDVAENRDLLIRRLKRLDLTQIDQAVNGVEALAAIRAKPYDLVLLDIMMPELDGFGVLAALREQNLAADLPIIVISAMSEIDAVVRCVELGAEDFLFKPFNPTLLRARVISSLEKKALRDRTREELRRKQIELAEARTLQLALAPPSFAGTLAGVPLAIDVVLEPAKEVGGDLVDHFRVGGKLVMLLGDVSDKGAGAALMMARTHAIFRGFAGRPDAGELFADPAIAMDLANAALSVGNSGCMFVTMLLGTLDLATRELRYVRAGHVPPFHRDGAGTVTRLAAAGGPPLGLFEEIAYRQAAVTLAPGDRLLIVTDGFTEAHDPAGALYGEPRIDAFMAALDGRPEPLQRLIREVRAFEAGAPAFDDMAAILLSLDPAEAPAFEADVMPQPEAISMLTQSAIDHLVARGVDLRAAHHVGLALDELLVNLGSHGGSADRPAHVSIAIEPEKVRVEVRDTGAEFDIRQAPEPVLSDSLAEREIGGLGVFLILRLASEIGYERRDGVNRTTFAMARGSESDGGA